MLDGRCKTEVGLSFPDVEVVVRRSGFRFTMVAQYIGTNVFRDCVQH